MSNKKITILGSCLSGSVSEKICDLNKDYQVFSNFRHLRTDGDSGNDIYCDENLIFKD